MGLNPTSPRTRRHGLLASERGLGERKSQRDPRNATRNYKTGEKICPREARACTSCVRNCGTRAKRTNVTIGNGARAHYGNKLIPGGTIVQKLRLADDEVQNRKAADPSAAFQSSRVRTERKPSILLRRAGVRARFAGPKLPRH